MCKSAAGSVSTVVPTTPAGAAAGAEPADVWISFAASVSGEWEGITASFNSDGTAIPLPEYYVPQASGDTPMGPLALTPAEWRAGQGFCQQKAGGSSAVQFSSEAVY